MQAGDDAADRPVQRRVRPQREQHRDQRGGDEEQPEGLAARPQEHDDPGDRRKRRHPADEDEALASVPGVAGEEVEPLGGVAAELGERLPVLGHGPFDDDALDEQPGGDGERDPEPGRAEVEPQPLRDRRQPDERVDRVERDRPEGEVHLSRERDRRDRGGREREPGRVPPPPPFQRPEGEREQHRNRTEQVAVALQRPVGGDLERERPDEGGSARQAELPQPAQRGEAREDEREQHEHVPAQHDPEQVVERPEHDPVRPDGRVDGGGRLGLELVRVAPRRAAVLDLVSEEPQVVARLQVVAGRRLAVPGPAPREELATDVHDPRNRREHCREQEDPGREGYKACAARSSSSTSGMSASS